MSHLYQPIESEEKLEIAISLATRQPNANESMVEAFAKAIALRNLQCEPMNGDLRKAFC